MPSLAPCAVNRIATDAFPASQRLDQWEAYNASFLVGLRCSSFSDEGLKARQSNMAVGQLALADIDGNAHVIERTPQLVRQHPKESVFVSLVLSSGAFFYQEHSCLHLVPGDLVIYDTRHAYLFGFTHQMHQFLVDTPADWFYRDCSRAQLPGPIRIAGEAGSGRVLNHAFKNLVGDAMARPEGVDQDRMQFEACDLLRAMMAGEAAGSSALRASHLLAARAHIDEHLHRHSMDAHEVATAAGVSLRHLNRLLQAEGRSVTQLILERRLERAAMELRQAALNRYSIAEIAYRCGFASQAHFARTFRSQHGMTPTQMREQPGRHRASI
ncbi:helix-turn-helix domain-containing protein [Comamonas resistens]|uniref:Helix-turn-helix domain-containing protein n=1 Tax=Comamonas resistens TaxID=3046670 RepID=A0ABY8SK50_9BURK|nr:helix-turn-helix domain-containing protein [Comamonas resistens]MDL5034849.1 helix-turn-helix domain-containing protein [Comamonas resistens]WHS63477.1 helix-turn-helix domain-containing protein [Comamonas resistens]